MSRSATDESDRSMARLISSSCVPVWSRVRSALLTSIQASVDERMTESAARKSANDRSSAVDSASSTARLISALLWK